ncbi:MAG: hypothetical protein RL711_1366, partial [Bacteroidota bacterium]
PGSKKQKSVIIIYGTTFNNLPAMVVRKQPLFSSFFGDQ